MLLDTAQGWVRDETTLKDMTQVFFSNLYKSVGSCDFSPILDQCPCIVTPEMNSALTTMVTKDEVRVATFQLGANKAQGLMD